MNGNELIWRYETHTEATAKLRYLKSIGCKAKMYLAYTGKGGWCVTAPAGY
jgi:hypothetical protein